MNRLQKAKIKSILLKMREDLISKIKYIEKETLRKSQKEASGDLSGYSFHMADVASDNFERELSLDLAENERELLRKIEDSMRRLKEKKFGDCQQCSKSITMKRLSAVPYALMCITCQKEEDKKSK
ncbi:MAG: TraR/DksA C4-type zinc finger protein [Candidatus Omnitrophica bacterium]|nr:TraR/DksA C4-type zinc finger protein [Candidatus Omnitrophota bacterium]